MDEWYGWMELLDWIQDKLHRVLCGGGGGGGGRGGCCGGGGGGCVCGCVFVTPYRVDRVLCGSGGHGGVGGGGGGGLGWWLAFPSKSAHTKLQLPADKTRHHQSPSETTNTNTTKTHTDISGTD